MQPEGRGGAGEGEVHFGVLNVAVDAYHTVIQGEVAIHAGAQRQGQIVQDVAQGAIEDHQIQRAFADIFQGFAGNQQTTGHAGEVVARDLLIVNQRGLHDDNRRRLMCLSMFWHFLDVVWIGVFTFVYLLGVLR